jgi:hypothetical protein
MGMFALAGGNGRGYVMAWVADGKDLELGTERMFGMDFLANVVLSLLCSEYSGLEQRVAFKI